MATATTIMRWEAIKAMRDAFDGLAGVQVSIPHPGDTIQRDVLWFGLDQLQGMVSVAAMTGGRPEMYDEFTFPVRIRVVGPDMDAAMTRCEQIIGQVQNVLSDDPDLNNLAGLDWAQLRGECKGPSPAQEKSGWYVFAEVDLYAHCTTM